MSNDSTSNDKTVDAAIRRVQKLLARTKEGGTHSLEEADTAMKIAAEIMTKYNLDMATVDAAGSGPADATDAAVRVDEKSASRVRFKWQQQLARYVAEANFCLHLIRTEYKREPAEPGQERGRIVYGTDGRYVTYAVHRFVGRKANVITTQLMFDYLCRAVEDNVPLTNKSERFSKASSSWKEGCAHKLCERLAVRRKDLMAEHDAKVEAEEARIKVAQAQAAKQRLQKLLGGREPTGKEIAEELRRGARVATGRVAGPNDDSDRPEVVKDGWVPGAGAELAGDEPVAPPTAALVLASVYDEREAEANREMAFGHEPGYYAKRRAEEEAREREEEQQRLVDEANGEKEEAEGTGEPVEEKIETPRQRERREIREAKEHEKNRRYWAREDDRAWRREMKEHARRDHSAYKAGQQTGAKIGLDPQVKARADAKRLEK